MSRQLNTSPLLPGKFTLFRQQIRTKMAFCPEWWTWMLSILVWVWLLAVVMLDTRGLMHGMNRIMHHMHCAIDEGDVLPQLTITIGSGLGGWMIMLVAMMFPVLNEQIRHVAFAIRKKHRNYGIASFLMGYTFLWGFAGIGFLLLMTIAHTFLTSLNPILNSLLAASGFVLAAAFIWLPAYRIIQVACGLTMPIRIQGWQMYADCFRYGLKTGVACLRTCWAPMAGLMLTNHHILLMALVTFIMVYARYRISHESKFLGYAWATVAIGIVMINGVFYG